MRDGFIKVAAVTPKVVVADVDHNKSVVWMAMQEQMATGTKICVFPELVLSAYTCNDLFFQRPLIEEAKFALKEIVEKSNGSDMVSFIGLPFAVGGKLYNCAAIVQNGHLLGLVPKQNYPNYGEFYEKRYFCDGNARVRMIDFFGEKVPFGANILLCCENIPELVIAAEICEDVWVPNPPSTHHALAGATVIANTSASDEMVGKSGYRESLIANQSARLVAAYIYANAGEGESTQDVVFGGHNMIAENGSILAKSKLFVGGAVVSEIDVQKLMAERRKMTTYPREQDEEYLRISFSLQMQEVELTRFIDPSPFVPSDVQRRNERCEEIMMIQAMGLKKRLEHTKAKCVVLGISGGLDSTLALLVCAKAFDLLGIERSRIHAITMPGFGTTDRTYQNACKLTKELGASLEEISICESVLQHFKDIHQDVNCHDVTYENAQARERTQILMDIANRDNGLVIGTGDLSELALGWATYNGDHMSMYAVNVSVPKTLVRYLVDYYAQTTKEKQVSAILKDVLDTPVSPELLPPVDGKISQKTEDLVGPYELHDFYLYSMFRFGFSPRKIYRLACLAFGKEYDKKTIYHWLRTFYWRFFAQQFKRSCLPDGPKVGSVAVSPRGDLRMPSDASAQVWLKELEEIEENLE